MKGLSEKESALLSSLDPDKIYIENVRSILDVSYSSAVRICETAVRQGLFKRYIEVKCPDGSVAAATDNEETLPKTVHCWTEIDGHPEEVEFATQALAKTTFYRLNDESDSVPYRQTA
jgi:hypothetical protein